MYHSPGVGTLWGTEKILAVKAVEINSAAKLRTVGADCGEGPPVPIPNTAVKLTRAEDTWLATARKNR